MPLMQCRGIIKSAVLDHVSEDTFPIHCAASNANCLGITKGFALEIRFVAHAALKITRTKIVHKPHRASIARVLILLTQNNVQNGLKNERYVESKLQ